MNLGPATNLDKRNKQASKKFDVDVVSKNCDIIVSFFGFLANLASLEAGFRIHSLQKLCFR